MKEGMVTISKAGSWVNIPTVIARKLKLIKLVNKLPYLDDKGNVGGWLVSILGEPRVVRFLEKYTLIGCRNCSYDVAINSVTGEIVDVIKYV